MSERDGGAEKILVGLTAFAVLAGGAFNAESASAQEAPVMEPTGIADIGYRTDCNVAVLGNGPTEEVSVLYLGNKGSDTVDLDVKGQGPTGGPVSIAEMTLDPLEVEVTELPANTKTFIIGKLSTGEVVEIPSNCYKPKPHVTPTPTASPIATPTPTATASPIPSPTPTTASPSPEATNNPDPIALKPASTQKPGGTKTDVHAPTERVKGSEKHTGANRAGLKRSADSRRTPKTLPETGMDVSAMAATGIALNVFGAIAVKLKLSRFTGSRRRDAYKPRHSAN